MRPLSGILLDGITLEGSALKIRRPKDYQPPSGTQQPLIGLPAPPDSEIGFEEQRTPPQPLSLPCPPSSSSSSSSAHIPGIVSTNVPDTPNKIFIGGLPAYLNDEQVKELVSSYGQLKSFNLVKDSGTGNSKGYAFFEYLDESVTDRACKGLNGMKLGEKTLVVQRATIGAKAVTPTILPTGVAPSNPTAANFLNLSVPVGTLLGSLSLTFGSIQPTKVLMLMNMLSFDDLKNDSDYNEVLEDVRAECERFGNVIDIKIPRPIRAEEDEDDTPGVGKIFVEFEKTADAQKAQQSLGGRKFQGRTVITSYFESDLFHQDLFE
eukprot:TRINITY_DN8785_c0_g1_i1.p1 TRINITY_DN8785_c0_g1~~TRINITY_DN8785_c0_g1_i1.p1  ORF type:complete len:321 (+),score=100.30 TRINITY_DN8785_c0_g1_i1:775-1737(+)